MTEAEQRQLFSPSKRKKKVDEETESATSSTPSEGSLEDDEEETETVATSVDDGLPHPRVGSPLPIQPLNYHDGSLIADTD